MSILRKYIKTILEAAVSPAEAFDGNLALLKIKNRGAIAIYVLYDPGPIIKYIQTLENPNDYNWDEVGAAFIVGYLEVWPPVRGVCWNAAEIAGSAAKQGYGPMMYDMALSDYGVLMPDRNGTSRRARKIWDYYASSRPDVSRKIFDDRLDPKTPPKKDDCVMTQHKPTDITNYAYFSAGKFVDTTQLENMHKNVSNFVKKSIKLRKGIWNSFDSFIADEGSYFFHQSL